jgi:hypothetical protein
LRSWDEHEHGHEHEDEDEDEDEDETIVSRTPNSEPRTPKGIHHRGTEHWSSGVQELQESEGRRVDCATAYVLTAPANGERRTANGERRTVNGER